MLQKYIQKDKNSHQNEGHQLKRATQIRFQFVKTLVFKEI